MKRAIWQRPLPLLSLALALMVAGQISLAHQRNGLSHQISLTQNKFEGLQTELDRMNLEMASLTRPERLRALATSQLGMLPPSPRQVVHP